MNNVRSSSHWSATQTTPSWLLPLTDSTLTPAAPELSDRLSGDEVVLDVLIRAMRVFLSPYRSTRVIEQPPITASGALRGFFGPNVETACSQMAHWLASMNRALLNICNAHDSGVQPLQLLPWQPDLKDWLTRDPTLTEDRKLSDQVVLEETEAEVELDYQAMEALARMKAPPGIDWEGISAKAKSYSEIFSFQYEIDLESES